MGTATEKHFSIRFKQIAADDSGKLYGLTEDGRVFWMYTGASMGGPWMLLTDMAKIWVTE